VNTLVEIDPYADDPVALRLASLEIPTPAAIREIALGDVRPRARPWIRTRPVRRAAAMGAVVAATTTASVLVFGVAGVGRPASVTVHIPGFTVLVAAAAAPVAPHTSREQATATAVAWLAQHPVESKSHAVYTGFAVTGATFEAGVLKVWEQCGAHWFLNAAENLWVIDLRAPAQLGSAYVQASVLVNDNTGAVHYTDALFGPTTPPGC
jgi:hypothetical protein